jgi:glycosyltransferase involved in cell wall biosynthesis
VIPALNEAPVIASVVRGLLATGVIDGVIVVDNGSTDATAAEAAAAGATVVSEPDRGYGRACRAGVIAAEAEVLLLQDGDGSDDPADVPRVLAPLLAGEADLVVGTRSSRHRQRGSMTAQQLAGNAVAGFCIRLLYGLRVSDLGPLRAIRRSTLLGLDMSEMTYGWSVEMVVKAGRRGLRYKEVPVAYRRRVGVTKVGGTWRGSLNAGAAILAAIARCSRWRPEPA